MSGPAHSFRLPTEWRVPGTVERACEVLSAPERFPDWWGDVYLSVEVLDRGGPDERARIRAKGRLPYEVVWTGRIVEDERPRRWVIEATGDLEGRGEWRLSQEGGEVRIHYDWRVRAEKPWMRALAPLLRPLFAWNHRWAMARGEEGLRRKMARQA